MCLACSATRQAEANRVYQRKRRQREKAERRLAAGLLKAAGAFTIEVGAACAHCGTAFQPRRTTAQFCSAKCRVAHHRQGG
jgi:hypothetical protein